MKTLSKFFKRFETMMAATAFAEAGEAETARLILEEKGCPNQTLKKRADRDSAPRIAVRHSR